MCDGQYDTSFVANFLKNTAMKEFSKSANSFQSMNECNSGTVFDSRVYVSFLTVSLHFVVGQAGPYLRTS